MKYVDEEGCIVYEGNCIIDPPEAKVIWERDPDDSEREDCYVYFPLADLKIWVGAVVSNSYGPWSDSWGLFDYEDSADYDNQDIVNYAMYLVVKDYASLKKKVHNRNKQIKCLRAALKKINSSF